MAYRIDLTPNASYTETVSVSQDDVGREIVVDLYKDGTAYTPTTGTTITMHGTKPSGLGYTITGTASGSTVTFVTSLEMTQEAGRFASEIVLTNGTTVIGTANFALFVEKNPHPENTIDGTGETMQNLTVRMDALEDEVDVLDAAKVDATGITAGYVPTADGQDGWSWEAQSGGGGSGLTDDIKQALLQIAQKVAYIDEHGQDYYDDLYDALYAVTAINASPTSVTLQTIGGTQQLTATTTPSGASVSWASSNTAVATVDSTGLVTSVAYGTCTITATAGSITASCSVVVAQATLTSITAVYTQSGTVYDTDSLDSLKNDLVVTAYYDNSTSAVVPSADYTLSGTLTEGTSTITVSYGGKTTLFNVTVTHYTPTIQYSHNWDFTQSLVDSVQGSTLTLSGDATRDSNGLHFTSANGYVVLTGLNVIGNCFEIDVSAYDRQGTSHGRLFTISQSGVVSSGFIYHNTGVWAIYSKAASSWVDSSLGATDLNGKTVTIKLLKNQQEDKNWMYVFVDGVELINGNMSGTTTQDAFLGSNNGQVAYNMTITGLRVYQEA